MGPQVKNHKKILQGNHHEKQLCSHKIIAGFHVILTHRVLIFF